MARRVVFVVAAVSLAVVLALWFDLEPRARFGLAASEYDSAATWVLANSEVPDGGYSVAVRLPSQWNDLADGGYAHRLRDTSDWVFFANGGSETIPNGYMFSADPEALPEALVQYGDPLRLSDTWWYGSMNAGELEAGYGQ